MRPLLSLLRCRRGSIPIMTGVMLLPMIVISGSAIDLVAHERMRSRMQDALDRGVLAAASLQQTMDTRETLESFIDPVMTEEYELDFDETAATNRRHITADLTASIETSFLSIIDIDTLDVAVHSEAEERRSNIEISLILDVSGSMRWNAAGVFPGAGKPNRIDALRPAAKGFIDKVLTNETKDYTTVSIVPFAGQVNLGPTLYDSVFHGPRVHTKSSCFELQPADFTLGMPNLASRSQVLHFTNSNHHNALSTAEQVSTQPWWCPDDPHAAVPSGQPDWVRGETEDTDISSVTLMSNDRTLLNSRIDALRLYDGTGTPIAMKWGLLFLDPALRPKLTNARATPAVETALGIDRRFYDRPAAFDDDSTEKFIVLMTDGDIGPQYKPKVTSPPIQYYNDSGRNSTPMSKANAETYFTQLCDLAKNNGVTIFTIGFDVSNVAAGQMTRCAADSGGGFYRVNSLNIAEAFAAIASAIQQIKLIG